MLTHIQIRNFAIIDELDLELQPGLTVITGETGAGKSIMIDAIGLALGDRAGSDLVRAGADKAEISLTLEVRDPVVAAWLQENDLDLDGGECILRRVVTREGRSRAYINGSPAPLARLRELGDRLVNIHGQHDHQALLVAAEQRALLDAHGDLTGELLALRRHFQHWQALNERYQAALTSSDERLARIDLLKFQIGELEELALQAGEIERLDEELHRLAHADRLRAITAEALQRLYEADEGTLYEGLSALLGQLEEAAGLDEGFAAPAELLGQARIQIEEAVTGLRELGGRLESDPERLAWVEQRLARAHELARKHHIEAEALPARLEKMQAELARLEGPEHSLEALEAELVQATEAYDRLAAEIGERRRAAAGELAQAITEAMQDLGMAGGRFEVALETLAPGERRVWGRERVQFLVSANPGQPPRPLAKVASGGELSRISLAVQLIAARRMQLPTLIFDEVDTGIGGAVADGVGRQLRALGERCQVFCVTHLPQVAAYGHQHYQVAKTHSAGQTVTTLRRLTAEERVDEIARMLGGSTITEQTRIHASEMLHLAGGTAEAAPA